MVSILTHPADLVGVLVQHLLVVVEEGLQPQLDGLLVVVGAARAGGAAQQPLGQSLRWRLEVDDGLKCWLVMLLTCFLYSGNNVYSGGLAGSSGVAYINLQSTTEYCQWW